MLQAIKELGELKLEREGRNITDLLSILVQNPNQDKMYPYTLVIVLKKAKEHYEYSDVRIEKTSESKMMKYLYRRGTSNGPNATPTAKITDKEKTFKKIKGWFKKVKTNDPLITELRNVLLKFENHIKKDLSEKWEGIRTHLKRKQGSILTLAIEEGNSLRYIGDWQIFKDLLIQSVREKYEEISKTDHICGICGEKKDKVYGNAIPIPFYTLDKPGYIAGGFQEKYAWKNAPICLDCSLKIEEGKKYLDENKHLSPKMGGQRYYLIPKFIFGNKEEIKDIIDAFFQKASHPEEILDTKSLKRISEDENEILYALADLKDLLTLNFLFYETPTKSTFKINLIIEDILPSRISAIFKAKEEADKYGIFKNTKVKKDKYEDIEFRFDEFRRFAPSQKIFLEVLNKIFRGVNIEPHLLFSWFMSAIRQGFVNESYLKPLVLKAFVSFLFFKKLEILPQEKRPKKGGEFMTELKEKAEAFFNSFPETFPTPTHKVVFLLGALTRKLLDIQYKERGATPFRKNLKGLKMQEKDFKKLLPTIQNKLEEYGKNYYRSLEELISGYFLQAGQQWRINTDELNFYFVLGMNLVDEVSKTLELGGKGE